MRFGILGPVEARHADGSPADLGGPKVRALLCLLLTEAGQVVSADRLIDGIYAGSPPEGAANALQSQVSRLRRQLGRDAGLVEFHPAGYRLAVEPSDVDAHRFARLAEEGSRALAAGEHRRAETLLGEALALWRGPALADLGDAPAARVPAARLDELWLTATADHLEAALELGTARELVPRLRELIGAHPLRERLRALLVRALAGSGRQAEALVAFEEARRTLAEELGADPSAELARAHLAVLRGEPAPDTALTTLPAQLTSFVGRTEELDRVRAMLDRERLVTLTGPGGTGKTRLAIEAAGRFSGDAVCFVELASLTDGGDLPQAVLAAMGLRETPLGLTGQASRAPAAPMDRLAAALADRRMLLVLDNCEHLLDAAAHVTAGLLAGCPRLRVLATSREPLGLTGETLSPVPPLALPKPDADLGDALDSAAVRLFVDRATAGRGEFAAGEATMPNVVRICRALDGLPLAIELAAARVRTLPVGELAARLDDRFELLSRGSRTAVARHRTLRAVVEWSWDLLDPAEQALARRLTVFAGGAGLDAAQQVCGSPGVVDLISGLVDKSLVELAGDRYRMLETIRAFCAERLAEAGETDRFRRAHAERFLELAETAEPHLRGAEQLDWLARLDVEYDNLLAALRWATQADVRLALRLHGSLSTYFWIRGRRGEGAMFGRELAGRVGPRPPDGLHEEYAICVFSGVTGAADAELLSAHLAVAERIVSAQPGPPRLPILNVLWAIATGPPQGDDRRLLARTHELLGNDRWTRMLYAVGIGLQQLYRGEAEEAERSLSAGLAQSHAVGERWITSMAVDHLAQLAGWRGDTVRALELYDEAIELSRQLESIEDVAELLSRRADCQVWAGDLAGARVGYQRSAELARRVGARATLAVAHLGLGELARWQGDLAEARSRYEQALTECPAGGFGPDEARLRVIIAQARLAVADGRIAEAFAVLRRVLGMAVERDNADAAANAVEALAEVAATRADDPLAARLLGAGVALRGVRVIGCPDVTRVTGAVRDRMGAADFDAAYARGRTTRAHEALAITSGSPSGLGA